MLVAAPVGWQKVRQIVAESQEGFQPDLEALARLPVRLPMRREALVLLPAEVLYKFLASAPNEKISICMFNRVIYSPF